MDSLKPEKLLQFDYNVWISFPLLSTSSAAGNFTNWFGEEFSGVVSRLLSPQLHFVASPENGTATKSKAEQG